MKKLWERMKQHWAKIKELKSDDYSITKNQNQCHFPGCDDFGALVYVCHYGEPCFCDYHSMENSPWTRSYLDKHEWQHKTIVRPKPLPLLS